MPAPIFLCGMMGAGKSTVGRLLAHRLGCVFIDLDRRIERIAGRTVVELFADGEPTFRRWERAALVSLLGEPGFRGGPSVVATGGGAVLDPRNLNEMNDAGMTLYLQVDAKELARRVQGAVGDRARPLLHDEAHMQRDHLDRLLKGRRSRYEACAVVVDGNASPAEVAERIEKMLLGAE